MPAFPDIAGRTATSLRCPARSSIMTTLERTLTKVLMGIVIGLDSSDDDAIAPKAIMPLLQPAIASLDELSDDDK
ncbi:hypothetical protein ACFWY5_46735 [Nonomuraea sp. NPDC059007]|uniref:hypothetical protein n=1 Tax=Nonomuraea sp. NPDC059007 TaxID=3346692 RepID=UPI0036D0572D